jgi:hypothetical protein
MTDPFNALATLINSRFDSIEERMERLETMPRLSPEEVMQIRRSAVAMDRAAKMVRWLSPKRIACIASVPSSGGALYFIQWVRHIIP